MVVTVRGSSFRHSHANILNVAGSSSKPSASRATSPTSFCLTMSAGYTSSYPNVHGFVPRRSSVSGSTSSPGSTASHPPGHGLSAGYTHVHGFQGTQSQLQPGTSSAFATMSGSMSMPPPAAIPQAIEHSSGSKNRKGSVKVNACQECKRYVFDPFILHLSLRSLVDARGVCGVGFCFWFRVAFSLNASLG